MGDMLRWSHSKAVLLFLSLSVSVYLSACLSHFVSLHFSVCLCLFLCLSVCLHVSLFLSLCPGLSLFSLSLFVSVCSSLCLCLSLSVSLPLSVCWIYNTNPLNLQYKRHWRAMVSFCLFHTLFVFFRVLCFGLPGKSGWQDTKFQSLTYASATPEQ